MRVSWRSHWQLRSTFCPFEAFYEMLKKKYEFADYQCGPTSGGWCTSWYIRSAHLSPTVRNPHSFLHHCLKKKKIPHLSLYPTSGHHTLCMKIAPHLETWTRVKWLEVCTFFFSVIVWRKSSTPEPISNFWASHSVYQNCTTLGNLDNSQVCSKFSHIINAGQLKE